MKRILLFITIILSTAILAGCSTTYFDGSHTEQQKSIEKNQKRLNSNYAIPQLDKSLEIENNYKRLEFLNKSDAIGYVYLMSHGKVVAFYTIQGKVSSLNSYATAMEQLVDYKGRPCTNGYENSCSPSGAFIVEAPDIDGSYGQNADGIYFFTTEGSYVEWSGEYMYTSEPLKVSTPLELVREVK